MPELLHFPADEFVLCTFAASSLGRHASSTSQSCLSALKAWHLAHNLEWKDSSRLWYMLNGAQNPPCPPINAVMLLQLVNSLDLNSPFDIAVTACAVTAF